MTNGPKSQRIFLTQPALCVLARCTSEQRDECMSSVAGEKWVAQPLSVVEASYIVFVEI